MALGKGTRMAARQVRGFSMPVFLAFAISACFLPLEQEPPDGDDGGMKHVLPVDFDPARSLVAIAGNDTAVADGADRIRVRVTIRDAQGVGVPDLVVTLEATGADHAIEQPEIPTDESGTTTGSITSTRAEAKTITARVETELGPIRLPARPRVLFVPGAASALAFAVEPGSEQAGNVLSPSIEVLVVDAHGNAVFDAEHDVTLALEGGDEGAVLAGTTTRAVLEGIATFDDLSIDVAAEAYSMVATADGLKKARSRPFAITLGPPAHLSFLEAPVTGVARDTLAPVRIALQDASGNTLHATTTPVTLSLKGHPGLLEGTRVAHPVDGVATFDDLRIPRPDDDYVLIATANGFRGAQSVRLAVLPAPAASLAFEVQPEVVGAGRIFEKSLRVVLLDDLGERVDGAANTISLTLSGGDPTAMLLGTSVVDAVDGVATFTDVAVDRPGADYVLAASADGLASADSTPFDVTALPPPNLVFETEPAPETRAGEKLSTIVVRLVDERGWLLPDSLTVVTLESNGSAPLLGTTTATAIDGIATFDDLRIESATTQIRLVAIADGFTGAESEPFDVQAAEASELVFVTQPHDAAPGESVGSIELEVLDRFGNRATTDVELTLSLIGGSEEAMLEMLPLVATSGLFRSEETTVDRRGVGYQLVASAIGFAPVSSEVFHVGITHEVSLGPLGDAGDGTDDETGEGTTVVFSPDELTIHPGEAVRWSFGSDSLTVTSGSDGVVDGLFCSPVNADCDTAPVSTRGDTFTHRFLEVGSFPYFSRSNATSTTGVVHVVEESLH